MVGGGEVVARQAKHGIQPNIPQSCTIKTHKQKYENYKLVPGGGRGGGWLCSVPSFFPFKYQQGPRGSDLSNHLDFKSFTNIGHFHSCNHQKWLPYQILGCKTVMNVQIDSQKTKILSNKLKWVSEGMSLWHLSNYREAELLKIVSLLKVKTIKCHLNTDYFMRFEIRLIE